MRGNSKGKRCVGGYCKQLVLKKSKPSTSILRYLISSVLFSSYKRKATNIKVIPFIVLFFMVTTLAGLYFSERLTLIKKTTKEIKIDSDASLVLNSMHHTSTRNGVKEWTLKAASAKVLKNEAKAIIMDIELQFFIKNGEQIDVTAKQGYVNTKENNIELYDNVVVKYIDSVLTTDQLHYDKKSHIISSNKHVKVISNTSVNQNSIVESNSMTIDLNSNKLEFKGSVNALLSDAIDFSIF